ncbi:phage shock protein PspC (stress-responsive transcriptional regulator) [Micromonospora profundi]|uniref:PspC domain-containing protein n=1 Tax=Micromonospora profundi TaxID=1420889 RepID=UPI00168FD69A|nr:PspC domain-containing protein [Micromonospora profundi]NJC16293.1 phage shock protein PspC (stress-responsive transcriptional regulator) [Micromonospora profundi]
MTEEAAPSPHPGSSPPGGSAPPPPATTPAGWAEPATFGPPTGAGPTGGPPPGAPSGTYETAAPQPGGTGHQPGGGGYPPGATGPGPAAGFAAGTGYGPGYGAGGGPGTPPPGPGGPSVGPLGGNGFTSRYGLVRPRDGRYLAGVCAAIGRATNTDPVLWRVLLAVLGFFGGIGILVYVAAWLIIPNEGDTASPVESMLGRGRSSMSPVTVIVLSILVAASFGYIVTDAFRAVLLGVAILIGGALLLNRDGRGPQPGTPVGTPPGPSGTPPGPVPPVAWPAPAHGAAPPAGPLATAPLADGGPAYATVAAPEPPTLPAYAAQPSTAAQSATVQPTTGQPTAKQPAYEQPGYEQPTEQPVYEQPTTEQPVTGQPVTGQPVTGAPADSTAPQPAGLSAPAPTWPSTAPTWPSTSPTWPSTGTPSTGTSSANWPSAPVTGAPTGHRSAATPGGYRPPFAPHGPYASATPAASPPPKPPKPPKRPRERSPLGAVTFSLIFLALGLVGLLDLLDVFTFGASAYFAAALATVGLGLLVGTWFGRARWLIALGLVTAAALGTATIAESYDRIRGVDGAVTWAPTTHRDLANRYENSFGDAVLDLRGIDFTKQESEVTVQVNFGHATVVVPPNVDVTTVADVNAGDAIIFGKRSGGLDGELRESTDLGADGAGGGTLRLYIHVNAGNLEVTR